MLEQLKNFVITKVGQFHDYSFLLLGMTPKDTMVVAKEIKMRSEEGQMLSWWKAIVMVHANIWYSGCQSEDD